MTREWETQLDTELGTGTLKIKYEYDPGEPRVNHYPDGSGSPGVSPSVTVLEIHYVLDEPDIDLVESIQGEILDEYNNDENPND